MRAKQRTLIISAAILSVIESVKAAPTLAVLATNVATTNNFTLSVDSAGDVSYGTNYYVYQLSGPNHQTSTSTLIPYQYGQGVTAVTTDPAGNLFVATERLGLYNHGSVLELSGPGHQTITSLVNFNVSGDVNPTTLIYGSGNLYATTNPEGGTSTAQIFKLSGPNYNTITSTYSLSGFETGVTVDGSGNIFGVSGNQAGKYGHGLIYTLPVNFQNDQILTTLYNFNSSSQSIYPQSPLAIDPAGNLYGTTLGGSNGLGAVYELSRPDYQTLNVLANFNGRNGNQSYGGLVVDSAGDLFGTTESGGAYNDGTIYELSGPNHQTLTTLASYQSTDQTSPYGTLSFDAAGNLYGIASNYNDAQADIYELTNTGFFVVPEPSCLSILALGALGLSRRPRPR